MTDKKTDEPVQLKLAYEEISRVAGRPYIREHFKISNKVSYLIPFNEILIRKGYNRRKEYKGIPELAASIHEHKLQEPLELDVLKDGRTFINKGHRRHRAMELLVKQGKMQPTDLVEFFPTPSEDTELKRVIDQIISNNLQQPFTPLESAEIAYDIKYNFGKEKSNLEVARLLGTSRQTVDNWINLMQQPAPVIEEIKAGNLSYTDATKFVRETKKADKLEEKSRMTSPKPKPQPTDALKAELAELKELQNFAVDQAATPESKDEKVKAQIQKFTADKKKSDKDREEVIKMQNIIAGFDKLQTLIDKLKGPAQTKDDITQTMGFIQYDLDYCLTWIRKNKKR